MSIFGLKRGKMPHSTYPFLNSNNLTTEFGALTPTLVHPIYPGDSIRRARIQLETDFAPLVAPIRQSCKAYIHYYFVPSRICSDFGDYEKFITKEYENYGTQPMLRSYTTVGNIIQAASSFHSTPNYRASALKGTFCDYMRVQLGEDTDYHLSNEVVIVEPFIAAFKVWLDHYVNQQTGAICYTSTGYEYYPYRVLKLYYEMHLSKMDYNNVFDVNSSWTTNYQGDAYLIKDVEALFIWTKRVNYTRDYFTSAFPDDISEGSSQPLGSTIDELRQNLATQEYKEKWALSGKSLGDWLWNFFRVKSKNQVLNRTEFLGGGRVPLKVSNVFQTSQTTEASPLANYAGYGRVNGGIGFGKRYFDEHGWLIGFLFFVPKPSYFQGIPRFYSETKQEDLYNEVFDGLGYQAVRCGELYQKNDVSQNRLPLGYQPKYFHLKCLTNETHGDFCYSMLPWHTGRKFAFRPSLQNVQQCTAVSDGINRIFAYSGDDEDINDFNKIWCTVYHKIKIRRKMRYFGNPYLK